jgi:alpha-mannosidase
MPAQRVHLICNAHLDPVWQWEWEEGAAAAVSTFRTAADLCEEFDGFIFNHNEVILYQWVEEYEPALFARIRRLVQEGRWHIMGGWHLQPDCNMPSGESFVRQILAGRRYFQEKFGAAPATAINFDPFGHTRGLAQILARSGYDSYLFCRPAQNDCPLPADIFLWVGYDGSEILAARASGFYNSSLGGARRKVEEWLKERPDEPCTLVLWGVGDHGGGPSRGDLRDLADLLRETADREIVHSTPEAFFAEVRALFSASPPPPIPQSWGNPSPPLSGAGGQIPRHEKDINPWAVGCYTSQVRVKQKHRELENALYGTEKMASAAALQGLMAYPRAALAEAQRDLLTCQFHDILPGSSIQPVEEMSLRMLDHGLEILSRIRARAFFALAGGQPPAAEGEIPILVYNPHPFPIRQELECEFMLADQNWTDSFTNVTVHQDDRLLPSQVEKELSCLALDWRKRVVFRAELRPGRMNRFDCRLEVLPRKPAPALQEENGRFVVRSSEMEAEISRETGLLSRYCVNGVEMIGPPGAFQPLVMKDNEDPWGMTVNGFREVDATFRLMTPEESARFSGVKAETLPPVRVIEDGPVRAVVEAVCACGRSALCQRYFLPKAGTEIGVETRVHWNEKDRLLKLSLSLPDGKYRYLGQVAYGIGELPTDGREAVAQKWVAAVSEDGGRTLTLINEGVYGSDFSEVGLRLTLLRSPAYAGHPIGDRPIVPQDRYTPRIDQGERLFRFWLNGGPAAARLAAVDREALARNEKPFALSFFPSGLGRAPQPFVLLSDDAVQLAAAKLAEDGDDLILRLFEPTGQPRDTLVSLPFAGMDVPIALSPFEIKTLRVDLKARTVTETDLMES